MSEKDEGALLLGAIECLSIDAFERIGHALEELEAYRAIGLSPKRVAELAQADTQGWIRCSERMPEAYCRVLVRYDLEYWPIALPREAMDMRLPNGGWQSRGIATHWLVLPELPKEE